MNNAQQKPAIQAPVTGASGDLPRPLRWSKFRQDAAVLIGGLLLFLVVMLLLFKVLFPVGTRLGDGSHGQAGTTSQGTSISRQLNFDGGSAAVGQSIASIDTIRRQVRFRSSDSLVWADAIPGNTLYDRDSVQTLDDSGAVIRFDEGTELVVGEQSIIVVQRGQQDPFLSRRRSTVVMMEGTLTGRVEGMGAHDSQIEIEMPNGILLVQGAEGKPDASEFRVEINPDDSTSVSLMNGEVQIYAGGKVVTLSANEGLVVDADGTSITRVSLPVQPVIDRPRAGQTVRFNDLPPSVHFRWHAEGGPFEYRFLLAADEQMSKILVDQRLGEARFSYANLTAGRYFWTVNSVAGWNEGPRAPVRELVVVRDTQPPRLELSDPPAVIYDSSLLLTGRTEPGSKVFVQGEPVQGDASGRFEHIVKVSPGTSLVLVEAMDSVGNVAYAAHTVTSKSGRH